MARKTLRSKDPKRKEPRKQPHDRKMRAWLREQQQERSDKAQQQVAKLLDIGWVILLDKTGDGIVCYATSSLQAESMWEQHDIISVGVIRSDKWTQKVLGV